MKNSLAKNKKVSGSNIFVLINTIIEVNGCFGCIKTRPLLMHKSCHLTNQFQK